MSLANYWRNRNEHDFALRELHLVVEHPDYNFPGGVLACSIYPFCANECTSWRIHRNAKAPTCERCLKLIEWLKLFVVLDDLKKLAKEQGVAMRVNGVPV